jgi:cell division ATPase FtsA
LQKEQSGSITLIYDLGGGTFDPALIEHTENGYRLLGSAEGIECGGKFFDEVIYQHFQAHYSFKFSDDESIQIRQAEELNQMCRFVKEHLSESAEAQYPVPYLKNQIFTLSQSQFAGMIAPMLENTFNECSEIIASAHKQWEDVDRILLVGGSTAIPCVRELLRKYLTGKNVTDIPVVSNKSEEGVAIDSLFAVSLGGIVYIQNKYYPKQKIIDNKDVSKDDTERNLSDFETGIYYFNTSELDRNWILAAYHLIQDYKETQDAEGYDILIHIFQKIVDNISIEEGNVLFNSVLADFGESSLDYLVEFLISLQEYLEEVGFDEFAEKMYEILYWSELTEKVVEKKLQNNDRNSEENESNDK